MLDFEPSPLENEKQTRVTQVRLSEDLFEQIDQAATSLGVDKSVFLRAAIAKEAERVLEAQSRHVLTPADAAQFSAALDTPPAPTPRALAAMKAYKARVIHAD